MKMDSEARRIYELKKDNIQHGEGRDVVKQVGDGKDIMSHLREYLFFPVEITVFVDISRYAVRANMAAPEEDRLPEEEIIGQMT